MINKRKNTCVWFLVSYSCIFSYLIIDSFHPTAVRFSIQIDRMLHYFFHCWSQYQPWNELVLHTDNALVLQLSWYKTTTSLPKYFLILFVNVDFPEPDTPATPIIILSMFLSPSYGKSEFFRHKSRTDIFWRSDYCWNKTCSDTPMCLNNLSCVSSGRNIRWNRISFDIDKNCPNYNNPHI